jgi:hypothetical protein
VQGVSDRDAFGNLIENDRAAATGLSGDDPLGPASAPSPAPAPAPAAFATATAPPPPPPFPPTPLPAPSSTRVKGSWDITDKLVGLFFNAIFVVPLGIGGWFAYATWHDTAKPAINAIKNIQNGNLPGTPDPGQDPATPAKPAAGPPHGLSARSLLKPAALDRVLASARRDPGGKLSLLRLAPDRADVQLARRGGGMDILQLRYDGGRSLVKTPGTPQPNTITFSTIDTHAPQRLVTAAAHRLHRSTKSIDYVVLIHVLGKPMWSAYFTGGAAFQADTHGRITRRIQ